MKQVLCFLISMLLILPVNIIYVQPAGAAQAPTISIVSPMNDSVYTGTSNIIVQAAVNDPAALVARVDFYSGTTAIGQKAAAPFFLVWHDVPPGDYYISAVAVLKDGSRIGSNAIHILIRGNNPLPVISITSPANNAAFTEPAKINIQAQVSDPNHTVARVDFYRGTTKIGEDTTAPYSFVWQGVGAGDFHLSAVAVDSIAGLNGSPAVHIFVNKPSNSKPGTPTTPVTPSSTPETPSGTPVTYGVDMSACNTAVITGKALYVSTAGNDATGDGSILHPYRTISKTLSVALAGTTIVLRGGTYAETQELRIRVPNITLRSYPGEWAVIDRSSDSEGAAVYFYVGSNGGKLQCAEVKGGFYVVSTETMWDWGGADRSGASNITIENTKLHDSLRDVVKIKPNSDHITIRHNEIYNSNHGQITDGCNAEGIDNVNGDFMLVQNNYIHNTCSNGLYFKGGASDGIVEYNKIEKTGGAGIMIGFDTSPEYFDLTVNPKYYENIRGTVRYNLIRETQGEGIGFYASKDAKVYNNTLVNTAKSYHNPIYFGVSFQDWETYAGRPASVNPVINNNLVSQTASLTSHMVGIRYSNELGGLSALSGNPIMKNNCYYVSSQMAVFDDARTSWSGNLKQWKAHINGDVGSLENDPQLDVNFKPHNPSCANMGY